MSLYSVRADLATALTTASGYPITDHVPDAVAPAGGFIEPAPGYVTHTADYGDEVVVKLRLWLIVEARESANEAAANDLDNLIKNVLQVMPAGYLVVGSGQPGTTSANGWRVHGLYLDLEALTTL